MLGFDISDILADLQKNFRIKESRFYDFYEQPQLCSKSDACTVFIQASLLENALRKSTLCCGIIADLKEKQ